MAGRGTRFLGELGVAVLGAALVGLLTAAFSKKVALGLWLGAGAGFVLVLAAGLLEYCSSRRGVAGVQAPPTLEDLWSAIAVRIGPWMIQKPDTWSFDISRVREGILLRVQGHKGLIEPVRFVVQDPDENPYEARTESPTSIHDQHQYTAAFPTHRTLGHLRSRN